MSTTYATPDELNRERQPEKDVVKTAVAARIWGNHAGLQNMLEAMAATPQPTEDPMPELFPNRVKHMAGPVVGQQVNPGHTMSQEVVDHQVAQMESQFEQMVNPARSMDQPTVNGQFAELVSNLGSQFKYMVENPAKTMSQTEVDDQFAALEANTDIDFARILIDKNSLSSKEQLDDIQKTTL